MSTTNILRWVAPGLMLALLSILVQRRLHKRFPVFFTYCLSIIGVTVLRFITDTYPTRYFLVYWVTEVSYLLIAFLAMLSVLRPLTELENVRHPWSRFLLLPFLFLVAGAVLWSALVRPINKTPMGRFASGAYVFVIFMCLMEFLLFLESLRAKGRYPIKWTRYEFGILEGFGVLAFLSLIGYTAILLRVLHLNVDPRLETFFQSFPIGAFLGSAVTWLLVFSKAEPPRPDPPPDLLGKLEDTARVLEEQLEIVREIARRLGLRLVLATR